MIEVVPLKDGPDFTGMVEVKLDSFVLDAWSGGSEGVLFTLDSHVAGGLFGKIGDAIKVIEANADPS